MARRDDFDWRMYRVIDEATAEIFNVFIVPGLRGEPVKVWVPNRCTIAETMREVRRFTNRLSLGSAEAKAFISSLSKQAEATRIQANTPGYKPVSRSAAFDHGAIEAFVTPAHVISIRGAEYDWHQETQPGQALIGAVKGSALDWQLVYRPVVCRSNYLAFSVGCAIAASLRRHVHLAESPIFALSGPSSTGKTNAAMTAAAFQGHPEAISTFDQTPRGLEETAAGHNDVLLVLNAAERSSPVKRQTVLSGVTHMIADGHSMVRSRGVSDRYPALYWTGVTLVTSNQSGSAIAAENGLPWEDQDDARYIDIPVPNREEGGIVDRPDPEQGSASDQAQKLIRELEKAQRTAYGALLEPWIRYLVSQDPSERARGYMDRFLEKIGQPGGLEGRIAEKFALVYAALKLANEDVRLLDWPKSLPLRAVKTLYERSRAARLARQERPSAAAALAKLLADPKLVRKVDRARPVRVRRERDLLGVICRHNQREILGLRLGSLREHFPVDYLAIRAWVRGTGAVVRGHGGRSTGQLPLNLEVGGKPVDKPRFLVLDRRKFRRALRKAQ